ncbi:MAG: beta-aspartyl-peptidase, partial [Symbiobacteriaceae bacterium]|nr:beta-aspartyl-peptidase [Symbiobacteriaceae bacterium]
MLKLIKNVHIFAPKDLGVQDLLLAAGSVIHVAPNIPEPNGVGEVEVIQGGGKRLVPGFIDMHIHMLGGGGEGGPATRTPEITLSQISRYGVTTAVGVLGTDGTTRSMPSLVAKAKALELEGLTTFVYTGSYEVPTPTITGSVRDDVILIEKVIGVGEVAISDHRSAYPTVDELGRLAMEARVGGLIGGKPGLFHLHVGGGKSGLLPLFEILDKGDLPPQNVLPTHCGRSGALLDQAANLAKMGGNVDVTAGRRVTDHLKHLLEAGAPLEQLTVSSDGNGSLPRFDANRNFIGLGVGSVATVL